MKKRLTGLLSVIFLLAACGPAAEPDVIEPNVAEPTAVVPKIEQEEPVSPTSVDPTAVATQVDTAVSGPVEVISPATTVDEAAVVRRQDHVIGAEEPIVAIIEYGDYQ